MDVQTLNELFFRAADTHHKPNAFRRKVGGVWQDISHAEVLAAVEELSLGLAALGVEPGDRVAIFAENRLEWALADYAILTAAAANVPVYSTLPPNQVAFILENSGSRVVFVSTAEHGATIAALRAGLRPDLVVVSFDPPSTPGVLSMDALRERGRELRARDPHLFRSRADGVRADDLASIIYTSGTTGTPKGVMLTHGNIVSNVLAVMAVLDIGPSDSCLSFLPLCHIFERMGGHYTMFHSGATIAYAESIDTVPQNLAEVQPTLLVSVPRVYEKMHARVLDTVAQAPPLRRKLFYWAVDVGRRRSLRLLAGKPVPPFLEFQFGIASTLAFSKLRARMGGRMRFMVSGGAPLGAALALFFHGAGLKILEGYGLTETSPVISCNRLDRIKLGTVGQPIPGVEVHIAEDGEILVRGPGVMRGYFGLPEATAEALAGGWFHTGDIGFLDQDGFLTITDRKKDLLVTAGGKNIAPQPIENRLKEDPYITEAVLIGDRRPYCIALLAPDFARLEAWATTSGIRMDREALCRDPRVVAFYEARVAPLNATLASFETIKRVALIPRELTVADGDLTPTLKVKRRVLNEKFGALIESTYSLPGGGAGH